MTEPEYLHAIDAAECWELLGRRRLGRLGVVVGGVPSVFPVNYAAGAGRLVFRSAPGAKLAGSRDAVSCFQVDDFDEASGSGWSVMLHGRVGEVPEGPEGDVLRALSVHPAAPGHRPLLLVFTPSDISGRRFTWGAVVAPLWR